MPKAHFYRMTEPHMDHLMTLNGDQLIHIIAQLTDRTVGILSAFYQDGIIPQETQDIFGVEKYDVNSQTHILGSITDLGAGVKEGHCSDDCWCKDTN
tara:strand:+ start:721 stop:1011 length:291 start_codon:yes stop_codon:yes gene_type:complete